MLTDSDLQTKLTNNFKLFEFIHSDIAWASFIIRFEQLCCTKEVLSNLRLVAQVLQDVRDSLEIPIYVNSGFRSYALNKKLRDLGYGASPSSKHLVGRAADVRGKTAVETRKIWNLLKKHKSVDVAHSYCKTTSKSTYIHFQLLPDA